MDEDNHEVILQTLAHSIKTIDEKYKKYSNVLEIMSNNRDHFTDDELEMVSKNTEHLGKESSDLREKLQNKLHIYEQEVLVLKQKINARSKLIEEFEQNGSIESGDQLYALLVKNHADFQQKLNTAITKMS